MICFSLRTPEVFLCPLTVLNVPLVFLATFGEIRSLFRYVSTEGDLPNWALGSKVRIRIATLTGRQSSFGGLGQSFYAALKLIRNNLHFLFFSI